MNKKAKTEERSVNPPTRTNGPLLRLRARHYATEERIDLVCQGGLIRSVEIPTKQPADLEASWVSPALFDLQINGCDGYSFNSDRLTVDMIRHVVEVCRNHGIGGFCPTLVTNSFEAITHGLATIRQACESNGEIANAVPAVHLEGPYISA